MGSVKDLIIIKEAQEDSLGQARFVFSDRYSVFDWGEMPDEIPHKGAAITILGAYFFEKLEEMNIPTHYKGVVEDDVVKKLAELKNPSNIMEVGLLKVIKPKFDGNTYDYSMYSKEEKGILIPLEIIYRNSLPPGSSVFRRLEAGEVKPEDLGLDAMPTPNQKLAKPIIDVSTKLEITDRYMTWQEAQQISGLSDDEISDLKNLTNTINDLITKEFAKIGLVNEDGKIETGFNNERQLMLVDVFGTLDECRFTIDGLPVSKEIARIHYRDTEWDKAVKEAKSKDRQNWKNICTTSPEPLPEKLKNLISQVYCSCTNEITGKDWFKDIPPLKDILIDIKELVQLQNVNK